MCIAILQPADKQVDEDTLRRCWTKNPHGGGFMYSNGERMIVVKELRGADHFMRHLARHAPRISASKSPVLYHFRWATHGAKDIKNCHPFLITSKLGFAHNGVFSWIKDNEVTSDTYEFNQDILKALPAGFIHNPAIMELLDDYVGWNRLVFLDVQGKYAIVNETSGEWYEGCWYSNGGFKEAPPTTVCKSNCQTGSGYRGWSDSEYSEWTERAWGVEATRKDPAVAHPTVPTRLLGEGVQDSKGLSEFSNSDVFFLDVEKDTVKVECDYCNQPILVKAVLWGDNLTTHTYCRDKMLRELKKPS